MSESKVEIGKVLSESEEVKVSATTLEVPPIDVFLIVPNQTFIPIATPPSKIKSLNSSSNLELPFQIQTTDVIHELRALIHDAPEGFWLGSFGLVPVESILLEEATEEIPCKWGEWKNITPPTKESVGEDLNTFWELTSEGVLGDFADISQVFNKVAETSRKGLKCISTSFTHLAMSLHLLRLRDTLYSTLPALTSGTVYDPAGLLIQTGTSIYFDVRGDIEEKVESTVQVNGKKSKSTTEESVSESKSTTHAFTDFKIEDLNPYTAFNYLKSKTSTHASPSCKSFSVSPWSPPPHSRKLRGDIVYLLFTSNEGETVHITGSTSGFWVSKCSTNTFDPSIKIPQPKPLKSTPYHTLFELFAALSPSFTNLLSGYIESQNPLVQGAQIYSTAPFTVAQAAIPWLVPAPTHTSDPFRTQLAYLLTSSTNAELLPTARDWIDEFGQFKDLPSTTISERLLRERLLVRVRAEFNNSAIRGCIVIANGDVPPLNPNDPPKAHTFINNNMLFTRAEDAVNSFNYLGGDAAARLAAGKDLAAVGMLEEMDIAGLSTLATVVVDYLGTRWIAQSLLPGLFKNKESEEELKNDSTATQVYPEGDEAAQLAKSKALAEGKPFPSYETSNKDDYPPSSLFRIVYGASPPDEPEEMIRTSAYFSQLAKKVAEKASLSEHKVSDSKGKVHQLWTSSEMHGIAAPDGKSYFIDCYRLHCVDVEFLEQNIASTSSLPAYHHSLLLLRSELLKSYKDSKIQAWVDTLIAEAQAAQAAKAAAEAALNPVTIEGKPDSVEGELKEASTDSTIPTTTAIDPELLTSSTTKPAPIITFNPDAFVVRNPNKGTDSPLIYDPEEESTKNVRLASIFLREVSLPSFIVEVVDIGLYFSDGLYLTKLFHRKGINMRYMGLMIDLIDTKGSELNYKKTSKKPDVEFSLAALKIALQDEMVSRSCKHILNTLIQSSAPYDHPFVIAHFFNCLVGFNLESHPIPVLPELATGIKPVRTWTDLTPTSLRTEIIAQAAFRFRYNLDSSVIDRRNPTTLLREICARVGIQLLLKPYNFGGIKSATTESGIVVEEEKSSDSNGETAAGLKKKKKKGTSSTKVEIPVGQIVSIKPEDVLNIYPIAKITVHDSALVEESYVSGQRAFEESNTDFGSELISDALALSEQIFGAIHIDSANKYHYLGLHYHEVGYTLRRKALIHEKYVETLQQVPEEATRLEFVKNNPELFLPNLEATKTDSEMFITQAARMVRQSVIISERAFGIESPDTISQYADLGLVEQTAGDLKTGLKMLRHCLDLWAAACGVHSFHPSTLAALSNATLMVSGAYGPSAAIPMYVECRKLATLIHGENSYQVANFDYQLSQNYAAHNGQFVIAYKYAKESYRVFLEVLGAEAAETLEVAILVKALEDVFARELDERKMIEERLKNKAPRITNEREARVNGNGPKAIQENVVEEVIAQKAHGQKAHLSLDELASFIDGTPLLKSGPKIVRTSHKKRKQSEKSSAA